MLSFNYVFDPFSYHLGGDRAFGADLKAIISVTPSELRCFVQRSVYNDIRTYDRPGAPPYPAVLCTSINHVVVHGIPSHRQVLREADLIGIDFACFKDGYCADAARTVAVGIISAPAHALLAATRDCLDRAIQECVPGSRLGDIGAAIQARAEDGGWSIVRDFVGHGIGRAMHEHPSVPNHGRSGRGLRLKAGMVIAIEPMLNAGGAAVRILDDGWTVVTADSSRSAHFEHTVAITDSGPRVLTMSAGA